MDIENIINSIYQEIQNKTTIKEKIEYFTKRSPWEQIGVFDKLNINEQVDLINNLSTNDKKSLFSQLSIEQIIKLYDNLNNKNDRINFCECLTEKQLKELYNKLDTQDKKEEFQKILQELHLNLEERKDSLSYSISTSYQNIATYSSKIVESNQKIENYNNEIKTNKQDLKEVKKEIKALDKEREKRLKKQLKASKPSKLDRIAIISKYRAKKLAQRTEELNQTLAALTAKNNEKDNLEITIGDLKQKIIDERTNISLMQETIKKENTNIKETTKNLNNLNVQIKRLSQAEKRILGRKLHNQSVEKIGLELATRRKNKLQSQNQQPQVQVQQPQVQVQATPKQPTKVTPRVVQTTSKKTVIPKQTINTSKTSVSKGTNSIEQAVQDLVNLFESMQQAGVSFLPNTVPVTNEQDENLANNTVSTISNSQQQVAVYAMGLLAMQLYQKYQKQQASQEQIQGKTRTLSAPGFVNLPLLLSIILFIFSLVLFFIK